MKQLLFKLMLQRFGLNLDYRNARLNRLSGELQSLMDSRPILIDFSGGIMMENTLFFFSLLTLVLLGLFVIIFSGHSRVN